MKKIKLLMIAFMASVFSLSNLYAETPIKEVSVKSPIEETQQYAFEKMRVRLNVTNLLGITVPACTLGDVTIFVLGGSNGYYLTYDCDNNISSEIYYSGGETISASVYALGLIDLHKRYVVSSSEVVADGIIEINLIQN